MRARYLAAAVLGLVVRLLALPLWGTFDVEVQKAWAWRAATVGLADIYGPSDRELVARAREQGQPLIALVTTPLPKTWFTWGTGSYFVDYPPGSPLVLQAAGRLYRAIAPSMPNRRLFNATVNLAPLLGSLAIFFMLRRSASDDALGWRRGLAFWLNPAMVLAAPVLGYQDTVFGALALGAVIALQGGRPATAAALTVGAGLVKPQGALLLPVLVAVTLRESRPPAWLRSLLAALGTALVVLAPWWTSGHLLSALDGCRRPLQQGTLAPLGLNLWWIAGYVMEWARNGPWPLASIQTIQELRAWAGFDPRLPARVLLLAATAGTLWLLVRAPRHERRFIALAVILQVHAYALVATSVHENHTMLAVIVAPLLLGAWDRARTVLLATSAFLFASLFLAAGWGRRLTAQRSLEDLRRLTLVDASVLVALAHVALVIALFVWTARTLRAEAAPSAMLDYRPMTAAPASPLAARPSGLRVVIVMPAYNAARTLEDTFRRIPSGYYDEIVVVDDYSRDETAELARRLSLKAIRHPHNVGYGGNQKTCYMEALRDGAEIVVMLHPDGQYDPAIIPEMIRPIAEGRADMVLGSRMMTPGGAARGGMPWWKRIANRFLTAVENAAMGTRFSECHTGYRAYSRRFLETVPFLRNSNGFLFDTEVIFQAVQFQLPVAEVPISTRYFADASSVGLRSGIVYGLGTLFMAARFLLHRWGLVECAKLRR